MLGWGAVMLHRHTDGVPADAHRIGSGVATEPWREWILDETKMSGVDSKTSAMSLSRAMSKVAFDADRWFDYISDMMDLMVCFLISEYSDGKDSDGEESDGEESDGIFNHMQIFESLLVGALLGWRTKMVKLDT